MSENEKEQGMKISRAKIYTGEGYDVEKKPERRVPRRTAKNLNRRKRRSEVLREEEERRRNEAAVNAETSQGKSTERDGLQGQSRGGGHKEMRDQSKNGEYGEPRGQGKGSGQGEKRGQSKDGRQEGTQYRSRADEGGEMRDRSIPGESGEARDRSISVESGEARDRSISVESGEVRDRSIPGESGEVRDRSIPGGSGEARDQSESGEHRKLRERSKAGEGKEVQNQKKSGESGELQAQIESDKRGELGNRRESADGGAVKRRNNAAGGEESDIYSVTVRGKRVRPERHHPEKAEPRRHKRRSEILREEEEKRRSEAATGNVQNGQNSLKGAAAREGQNDLRETAARNGQHSRRTATVREEQNGRRKLTESEAQSNRREAAINKKQSGQKETADREPNSRSEAAVRRGIEEYEAEPMSKALNRQKRQERSDQARVRKKMASGKETVSQKKGASDRETVAQRETAASLETMNQYGAAVNEAGKNRNEAVNGEKTKHRNEAGDACVKEQKKTAGAAPVKNKKPLWQKDGSENEKEQEQGADSAGPKKWSRIRDLSSGKKLLWGFGGVAAVIYVAVAVYFGFHFYGGTTVYGIDCSRKTAAEVKAEIEEKLGDYVLEIQERENKTETITADQIDLQYEDDGSIDRMLRKQYSYIWPFMILFGRSDSSPVAFSYNIPLAKKSISSLACMDASHMVAPHDAYISPTDTGYEVAREVMGTTLDESGTQKTILEALNGGKTQLSLEDEDCYVNPTVFQDDETLQRDAEAMSKLASANITLDFGNTQEIVNASVIQKWITKMANGEYVIDDVKVTEYVESLAARYDTFGLPVDFYTSIGTTVTLSGGDYGWCIDQKATVIALLEALNTGYRGTMEPVYTYEGMSHENGGIGYTYVEICISRQEMWCYSDGNLVVDTPVVTGNPNKGNGTPAGGVWAIDAKQRNAVLVGEDYRSPVDYWMPFNGNIGIHDLQTRAYFGDTIYLYAGSHGCVNTPYEAVQMIYDVVSVGTPVIVYD